MAGPLVVVDTIQGSSYPVIRSQMGVAERRGWHPDHYRIEVHRDATWHYVLFLELGKPEGEGQEIAVRSNGSELTPPEISMIRAEVDQARLVDRIRGHHFQWIQAAMPEFEKKGLDLTVYTIRVGWDQETVFVMFSDKDRSPGALGGSPGRPSFEVELDPKQPGVLKSRFSR